MSGIVTTASVRDSLCQRVAGLLNAGASHVRIRVLQHQEKPIQARIFAHQKNHWQEEEVDLTDSVGLPSLAVDLAMLASRGHSGDLTVRQVSSAEAIDTDLQFRDEWVETHRGKNLASFVEGLLFHDPHATGQDSRRGIRTPHRGG